MLPSCCTVIDQPTPKAWQGSRDDRVAFALQGDLHERSQRVGTIDNEDAPVWVQRFSPNAFRVEPVDADVSRIWGARNDEPVFGETVDLSRSTLFAAASSFS